MVAEKTKYPYPFPIVPWTKVWFGLSLLLVLLGIGKMVYNNSTKGQPLDFGIDFTGGASYVYQFNPDLPAGSSAEVIRKVRGELESKAGVTGAAIQVFPQGNQIQIRTRTGSERNDVTGASARSRAEGQKILETLTAAFGHVELIQQELVGPVIGDYLRRQAGIAVVLGCLLIMAYIYFRYNIGGLGGGWLFGIAAVVALVHDVIVLLLAYAFTGHDIDTTFIATILTVIGFSMQDTVIIFDRIRENLRRLDPLQRRDPARLADTVEASLWQTMTRSVVTVTTTVLPLVCLFLFGGVGIRNFAFAMFIGMVAGAYSSIFLAGPLLLWLQKVAAKRRKEVAPAAPVRTVRPVAPSRPTASRPSGREIHSISGTTSTPTTPAPTAGTPIGADDNAGSTARAAVKKKPTGGGKKRRY